MKREVNKMEEMYQTLKTIYTRLRNPSEESLELEGLSFMRALERGFVVANDERSRYEMTSKGIIVFEKLEGIAKTLEN